MSITPKSTTTAPFSPSSSSSSASASASSTSSLKVSTSSSSSSILANSSTSVSMSAQSPHANKLTSPAHTNSSSSVNGTAIPSLRSASGGHQHSCPELVVKCGYLQKKADNLLRNFHKRYFVLTFSSLSYYDSEKNYSDHDQKHGTMSIKRAVLRDGDDKEREFLLVDQKSFYIRAADKKEKEEWLDAIKEAKNRKESQSGTQVESFDDDEVKQDPNVNAAPNTNNTNPAATPTSVSDSSGSATAGNTASMSRQSSAGTVATPSSSASSAAPANTQHAATPTASGGTNTAPTSSVTAEGTPKVSSSATTIESVSTKSPSESVIAEQRLGKMVDDAHKLESKKEPSKEVSEKLMRRLEKSRKCQELFSWPSDTLLLKDVACGLEHQIALYGRLFITNHYLGFHSSVFQGAKVSIKVEDISKIEKANSALVFPNALRIFIKPERIINGGPANYFLTAFAMGNRNKTYTLISALIHKSFDIETFDWSWKAEKNGAETETSAEDDEEEGSSSSNSQATTGDSVSLPGPAFGVAGGDGADVGDDDEELPQKKLLRQATHLDMPVRPNAESECKSELVTAVNTRLPLSTAQLFHIFMDNVALYSFEDFHNDRQDMNFNMSSWKKAIGILKDADDKTFIRDISLSVKVKDSPMGPDQTRVMKVQKRIHGLNAQGKMNKLKLETNQVIPDVPFGSCFHVLDRWNIEDIDDGSSCQIKVEVGLIFDEMPWKLKMIKGMVESRTIADLKKEKEEWINKAQKWIEHHTEEIKIIKRKLPATVQQANSQHQPSILPAEPMKRSVSAPEKDGLTASRPSESPAPILANAQSSHPTLAVGPSVPVQDLLFPLGPVAPMGSPLAEFVLLMILLSFASLLPGALAELSFEGVVVYLLLAILSALKKRKID